MSNMTTLTFSKVAPRVYTARSTVCVVAENGRAYETTALIRLDGRGGKFYRVDRGGWCGWEAVDGGEQSAPRTLRDAKALANDFLARVRDQGTLTPRAAAA